MDFQNFGCTGLREILLAVRGQWEGLWLVRFRVRPGAEKGRTTEMREDKY